MKKIGIMTFHNAMSYGAVLQAYALQTTLHNIGGEAEIIDYVCEDIYNAHVRILPKTKNWKFNVKMLLMGRKRYQWREHLKVFREKYLVMSRPVNKDTVKNLAKDYEKFVAGSDQVFNTVCTGVDRTYFLDFVPDEKKYTYAASFGVDTLKNEDKKEYEKYLKGFQKFSIRENTGCQIINDLLNRDAECNIDPTFLLQQEEWDKVVIEPKKRKPYILMFSVLKPLSMIDYALNLGKEKGLDVLYLENYTFPKKKGLKYIGPVNPAEFIGLIKNAEYVVTNSFHGMAFSIIYKKNFIVELNTQNSRNYRCEDLLKKLGIKNNELIDGHISLEEINYNWNHVQEVVQSEREKSIMYLKSII